MADRIHCPTCGRALVWTGSPHVHRCRCECGYEEWHALKPMTVFHGDEPLETLWQKIARWFGRTPTEDRGG